MFADNEAGFFLSGWFEPGRRFPGNEKYFASLKKSWPKNHPPMENVSFSKQGIWEIIWYTVPLQPGPHGTQQNIHANHVEAGTWLDLHISTFPYGLEKKELISRFLASAQVETKPKSENILRIAATVTPKFP